MMLFLAQSDTTAGFLSKSKNSIILAKQSNDNKPILVESNSLYNIKAQSRIPKKIGKDIRRSKKTTFIFQNKKSFRLINHGLHYVFLNNFKYLYSSSANLHKCKFDLNFAKNITDVWIYDKRGIFNDTPSKIFKVRRNKIIKIR